MKRLWALAAVVATTAGLGGCVVAPPYGYGYAPAYGYAPGYYAGPSVSVGVGYSCCWGHGAYHR
ncbi:hypothetical protein H3V53_05870 [Paraburkholderia bengalensis]|uniref:Lipoprotein n=1 Tax=Paraburkholderia bengalensis TaxID=2747562 RepID=A0ABU8IMR4_9BURK